MTDKLLADAIQWAERWVAGSNPSYPLLMDGHVAVLLAAARVQVPREPTKEMLVTGWFILHDADKGGDYHDRCASVWRAMYDASPINALHETED